MKMKKLIGSLIATVMAMGMVSGTSVNAAYKPNPTVVEWDYDNQIWHDTRDNISYSIHCSIDNENIVYLNINIKERKDFCGWSGSAYYKDIISITTPANYAISAAHLGRGYSGTDLNFTKTPNGDGTTTWAIRPSQSEGGHGGMILLCPVGTNNTENTITFKDYEGNVIETYTIQNYPYGDINKDGILDARDASMLLTLYARQSVGENITLDQLIKEQKGE